MSRNARSRRITVIIPMYNEEDVLPELYRRLTGVLDGLPEYAFELLFVDDGSRDATLTIVRGLAAIDERVSFLALSRNFGKEQAMLAGFDAVDSDAAVIIDADLQDPPELIPAMLAEWEDGYDDVYAVRTSRNGESWLKKATSKHYYRLLQRVTKVDIQADTGDFRLLDRKCLDALRELRENERYTKGMFSWIGFEKKAVYYHRDSRRAGDTKWSYPSLVCLAVQGITSFTTAPLRLATVLGSLISLLAFVYLLIIVGQTIILGIDHAGYASTMAVILFLGGAQLLCLGVVGEYVARIFKETKHRPTYLVRDEHRAGHQRVVKPSGGRPAVAVPTPDMEDGSDPRTVAS